MMGTKLIKLAIFLSYFVSALVVENNGDMLNGFKNLFDGWFGNYKNTKTLKEIVDKLMFDSEKSYNKIVSDVSFLFFCCCCCFVCFFHLLLDISVYILVNHNILMIMSGKFLFFKYQ